MLLHRQPLLLIPLTPIQRLQRTVQIPIEEKNHTIPLRRVPMHDPVHAALVPIARPLAQHVPHIDDVGVRVRRQGHPFALGGVVHLEPRVLIRQQQRDGAKVRVRARAELRPGPRRRRRGRVVQQAQGRRGRVGDEVVEDARAVRKGGGEQGEHTQREVVDGLVVAFAGRAEVGGREQAVVRPDVGAHEEAADEGTWVVGGNVGADVEAL